MVWAQGHGHATPSATQEVLIGVCFIDPDDVKFKGTVLKKRGKSWLQRGWKQLYFASSGKPSARKLAPGLILGNQSVLASWKPADPPGSVWRELNLKIMKITVWEGA